jgi:hypothetical protein
MVDRIPSMVSMEATTKEKEEMATPATPKYPWGLSISLCQDELDKLGLSDEDIGVGDMLHLHCLTKVTSVSSNENEDGDYCRVELQITHIAAEDEDAENEEPEKKVTSKLYRK